MQNKYKIELKAKERKQLEELISKGREKARKLTRCRILLLSDRKEANSKISRSLDISLETIRRIQRKYVENGLETTINECPRPGKPPKFNGKQRAKITMIACSTAPEGRSRWTLRLLADRVVELAIVDDISYKTVGEILKKRIKAPFKETMVHRNNYA